jgi:AraC-like DNA-binding protein
MPQAADESMYLAWDEICPVVDLAACTHNGRPGKYGYRLPAHQFIYVDSGTFYARTRGLEVEAAAGDLLCLRPSERYDNSSEPDTLFYQLVCAFAPAPRDQMTPWLDGIGPLPIKLSLGERRAKTRTLFETLCLEIEQTGATHRLQIQAIVFELLSAAAEAATTAAREQPKLDQWQRARMRLSADFSDDLPLGKLAREMGISVDHFIRRFKQRFGMSPKEYRIAAKMRHAVRLLRSSDQAIKSIAFELGFADANSFTRAFRKHVGFPPTELRAGLIATDAPADLHGTLFPMNRHLLPPDAAENYFEKYGMSGRY